MNFDGIRLPDTRYVAGISRGKDSIAMLHVIKDVLHWPLDGIITVHVWATQDVPAELPPMTAWQDECDSKLLKMFGLPVERLCARDKQGNKLSYNDIFYRQVTPKRERERERRTLLAKLEAETKGCAQIPQKLRFLYNCKAPLTRNGFPYMHCCWCRGELKMKTAEHIRIPIAQSGVVQRLLKGQSEVKGFPPSPGDRGLR